jgi:hypothetical protein
LVDVTTVDDLTSVVVHELDVVAAEEGAAVRAGAVAWLPALGAFDPAAATDPTVPAGTIGTIGGGGTCLAGVERVVSGRALAVLAALRTLSVGRAGEADRAVASRASSIIAD